MTPGKSALRLLFAVVLVASASTFALGSVTGPSPTADGRYEVGEPIAEPRQGATVVATDSNSWLGQGRTGPRSRAELLAIGANGSIIYVTDTHTRYWDVDPVPGTRTTVQYVAADHLATSACGGEVPCTRNVVERVNLSTGETTRLFSRVTPRKHSTRWHDVDRLDATRLVVADIARDRVFVVNTTTGLVTWSWSAQQAFDVADSGGPYPSDWTHLNDVEVLSDGRIVVSLRNHDQVVFLDPGSGLQADLTLGEDDEHATLYEQHNPDYLPASRGGPALLVADSENNRVVEYQRVDGEWRRTWLWRDARLQWPRDADRLPNGHTLVTDSNGDRVLEVDEHGEVVWQVEVAFPYEAERLDTGEESAGGPSAQRAGLANASEASAGGSTSGTPRSSGAFAPLSGGVNWLFGGPTANVVAYVLPVWMGGIELAALLLLVSTLLAWGIAEVYWAPWSVSLRRPIAIERRR